jgi:hypothetical protein
MIADIINRNMATEHIETLIARSSLGDVPSVEPEWFLNKYVRRNYGPLPDDRAPDVLEEMGA